MTHGPGVRLEQIWKAIDPWFPSEAQGCYLTVRAKLKKKKNMELTHDPAIPLLGIYSEKTIPEKDTCTPLFVATLFTVARTLEKTLRLGGLGGRRRRG